MKYILLTSCLIIFIGLSSKGQIKKVNAKQFYSLIKETNNHILIDVNKKENYLEGHISNAIFTEVSENIYSILDTTSITRPVLIYCKYGKRCIEASKLIAKKYPHQIFALKKGIEDWKAKGYKVVSELDDSQ